MPSELGRTLWRERKTCDDEEDELEELEVDDDEVPGDCEVEEFGGLSVEDEGDEGGREVGLGVSGVEVGETTGIEGFTVGLGGGTTGSEVVEVPGPPWRLCNQCRFSSTS